MTEPTPMTDEEKTAAAAGLARLSTQLFGGAAGWATVVAVVVLTAVGLAPPWQVAIVQALIAGIIAAALTVTGVRFYRYGSSMLNDTEQPPTP